MSKCVVLSNTHCDQVCEPICEPPKCSKRSQVCLNHISPPTLSQVKFLISLTCRNLAVPSAKSSKCSKPVCEVCCPVKHCEKGRLLVFFWDTNKNLDSFSYLFSLFIFLFIFLLLFSLLFYYYLRLFVLSRQVIVRGKPHRCSHHVDLVLTWWGLPDKVT